MFVKKSCVVLVNAYAYSKCFDQLQGSEKAYSQVLAGLAVAATLVHTGIWFCTFFFLWVPCCKEDEEKEESSSGESSDEEDAYMGSVNTISEARQSQRSVEGGTAMRGVGTGQDPGDSLRKRRDPELEPEPEPQAGVSRPASPGLLAGAE